MSSRLQLDMRNLSLGRRHLVNAYEVKTGISSASVSSDLKALYKSVIIIIIIIIIIGVIAGKTVWSMPERLECKVLQKARYINTLTFTFFFLVAKWWNVDGYD